MSDTKKIQEPLLSDDMIRDTFMYGSFLEDAEHGFVSGANYVRNEYEIARAKDRELIQELVDALDATKKSPMWFREHPSESWIADALASAKAAGFTPTTDQP